MSEQASALLSDVKQYLHVTWQDSETDNRIGMLIDSGIAYLNDKYGEEADYASAGYPRTLLFDYVRYARDSALDVFEANYLHLILAMQIQKECTDYAEKSAVSSED